MDGAVRRAHCAFLMLALVLSAHAAAQSTITNFVEVPFTGLPGEGLAAAVAGLGDLDGDGRDDFALGFPTATTAQGAGAGRAVAYSGSDRSVLWAVEGDGAGDGLGSSLAAAGDVDGDGVGDLIAGAPFGPAPGFGYARVYSGLDGSVLHTFHAANDSPGTHFGEAVAGDADLDADGHTDLVVLQHDNNQLYSSGIVRAYSGDTGSLVHEISGFPCFFGNFFVGTLRDADADGHDEFLYGTHGEVQTTVQVISGATGLLLKSFVGLGDSAADAGDLDGDGVHDLLLGSGDVFAGGSWASLLDLAEGGTPEGVGDVDGDGKPDLALSRSLFSGADGARLFDAPQTFALVRAGDVDGDGRADLLARAVYKVKEEATSPALLWGHRPALQSIVLGESDEAELGSAVADAGDIDADGYSDVIVGLPSDDTGGPDAGAVRVLSGADGSALLDVAGGQPLAGFGTAVASAGDFDGDGVPDIVVGTPAETSAGGSPLGNARVLSGADGQILFDVSGTTASGKFGAAVASAGDVNADGFADIVVGAPRAPGPLQLRGRVSVFAGPSGALLFEVTGPAQMMELGSSVVGAGDVDGDGRDDVLAGAPGTMSGQAKVGSALILSGAGGAQLGSIDGANPERAFGTTLDALGDLDADDAIDFVVGSRWLEQLGGQNYFYDRAVVVSGASRTRLFTWTLGQSPNSGAPAVGRAGDVDGDGTPDVAVGARTDDLGGALQVRSGATGAILLAQAGLAGDGLAKAVGGGGDANGDGRADVIVGVPGDDAGGLDAGAVRALGLSAVAPPWTFLGHGLVGAAGLPVLLAQGTLAPLSAVELSLASAAPRSRNALFIGLRAAQLPFHGGTLVPSPDVVAYMPLTDASGAWQLAGHWPAGLPAGTSIWFQVWIHDGASLCASNALLGVTP